MDPPADSQAAEGPEAAYEIELDSLRERLERSEEHMASALMRATRLAQVISVLGNEKDLETMVERAAIEVGELFFADIAVLILDSGAGLSIAGHWGLAASDLPSETFELPGVEEATGPSSVCVGPADSVPLPDWLAGYSPRHVAWVRLIVGEQPVGLMLLARRGDEPFEDSEATELRAVAYRVALAIENGVLHNQMKEQLAQLHRLQELTAALAGMLELGDVGRLVADTLVAEVVVSSSAVLIERSGELIVLASAGGAHELGIPADGDRSVQLDPGWTTFPLEVADREFGVLAVAGAPAVGSEHHELLLHLVNLGALSLDKALLYEQTRDHARHDSLTGLLGHRVFHEVLEGEIVAGRPFSVLVFDIDDFKQINDLHGHQSGDHALRLVAEALQSGTRSRDTVFRIGGEEFCAVLPGLSESDAYAVAEGIRQRVARILSVLPTPITVSVGVATFPADGRRRDELLARADGALYAAKGAGKNCTSTAGEGIARDLTPARREVGLELLQAKDPVTVSHSIQVAVLTVEIARELGLDDGRLDDVRTAARLHDIGKLGVPDSILNKPGPLDDEEFRLVKTHSTLGAELLRSWGLTDVAMIVMEHHERIDGSGYPVGLRGEQIRIEARVIHAADAYVAMTVDQPYRSALSQDEAFAELVCHSGTQFDPDVVAALIALERRRSAICVSGGLEYRQMPPRPRSAQRWAGGRPAAS